MKQFKLGLAAMGLIGSFCASEAGALVIYGNSAGSDAIHYINSVTGVESQRFTPSPSGNGRGVVTVGDTVYYTFVGDAHIYKMDRLTGTAQGSILTSNQSMSTIAYDGTNFWTADYSGTNRAFQIDPITGLNIKTISLANATGNMDGLEWYNGKLIGNRCDACGVYDIYDLNGNVLQANFISTGTQSTGIAFDGTDFYVSNVFGSSIGVYDGVTGMLKNTLNLSGQGSFLIEDLSFDYAARSDTGGGGGTAPEPATLGLLGLGLLAGAAARRRKAK